MFEKLTAADIQRYRVTRSHPEYLDILGEVRRGEGGRIDVSASGVGRQTVKNRLRAAAEAQGLNLRFVRSTPEWVVFEIVDGDARPRRTRRRSGE